MNYKVSNKGLAEIASHEGIVLSPYLDSVGVWTIGIGHTANAGGLDPSKMDPSDQLSVEEVMNLFRKDIKKFEGRVNDAIKVDLEQHEFDALVSFDYNTGGIYKAKLTTSLNAGNKIAAGKKFMGWVKPKSIIPRRKAEMNLFKTGKYGNGFATTYKTNGKGRVSWSSGKRVDVIELMRGHRSTEKPVENISKVSGTTPPKKSTTLLEAILWFIKSLLTGGK